MTGWLKENGLDLSAGNLTLAFETLLRQGKLITREVGEAKERTDQEFEKFKQLQQTLHRTEEALKVEDMQHADDEQIEVGKQVTAAFLARNPQYYPTEANRVTLCNLLVDRLHTATWSVNNLEQCLEIAKAENLLEVAPTPEPEPVTRPRGVRPGNEPPTAEEVQRNAEQEQHDEDLRIISESQALDQQSYARKYKHDTRWAKRLEEAMNRILPSKFKQRQ